MRTPHLRGTRRTTRPLSFEFLEDRRLLSVGQTLTSLGLPAPPPTATVNALVVAAPSNAVMLATPSNNSSPNTAGVPAPTLPALSTALTASGALPQVQTPGLVTQPAAPDITPNLALPPLPTPAMSPVSTLLDSASGLVANDLPLAPSPLLAGPGDPSAALAIDTGLGLDLGLALAGGSEPGVTVTAELTTGGPLGLGINVGLGGGDGFSLGINAGVAVGSAPVLNLGGGVGQGSGDISSPGGLPLGGLFGGRRDGGSGTNGILVLPDNPTGATIRPIVLLAPTNRPGVLPPGQPPSGGGFFAETGENHHPVRVLGFTHQELQGDFAPQEPVVDTALKDGALFGAANDQPSDGVHPVVPVRALPAPAVGGIAPPAAAPVESLALPEPQGAGLMGNFMGASLRSVEEALQQLLHRLAGFGMELSGLLAHPHLVMVFFALSALAVSCEVYRRRGRRLRRGLRLAGADGPSWQWFPSLAGPGAEEDS
jgi:hypothetical protein